MCGIVGIRTLSENISIIRDMNASIKHRGPDGEGVFLEKDVALGHRRLAILDLSKEGNQPMWSSDKNEIIVFNGEIYNYIEIRDELISKGRTFKTSTDTEVILESYKEWGFKCLEKFNGMFAFCIFDKKKNILFLARDRLGIKPLYFYSNTQLFAFSSEIKGLLKLNIKRIPNDKIIYDYLTKGMYDHTAETFFKDIFQLEAGHYLVIDSKLIIEKFEFWNLIRESEKYRNIDFKKEFGSLIQSSISIQLRSDVPVGLNLSGGIDSATLAALTINLLKQNNLKTFTMGFSDTKDERDDVEEVLKYLKCNNNLIVSTPDELKCLLDEALHFQDQPFGGLQTVAYMRLAKVAKKEGFSVILEGQGGDELFAGYKSYLLGYLKDCINEKNDKKVIELLKILKIRDLSEVCFDSLSCHTDLTKSTWTDVLSNEFTQQFENLQNSFKKPFRSELLNMQYQDIKYLKIPRVLRFNDHMTMSTAVELRVPFLDHRIVELAIAMPPEMKIQNGLGKYILREQTKDFLPEKIRFKPKKSVVTPQTRWLQTIFRDFVNELIDSDSFKKRRYFDFKKVKSRFNKFCNDATPENSFPVWQWIMLELWFRKFIDPFSNKSKD